MTLNFDYAASLKKKLDNLRPLSEAETERLREYERIEMVYTSNALEGNTITEFETKLILEEGLTIEGKSMTEHLEIVNLNDAIDFVENLVKGNHELDERTLKEIHYLVYNKVSDNRNDAGQYRNIQVEISASQHVPPPAYLIQDEMDKFFEWNKNNQDTLHPIEYAALLHEKFVTIHPFINGNGRTARLLMNFALTRNGYPPIAIKPDVESRKEYNKSLEHAQVTGDTEPFIQIVQDLIEKKLEKMIETLEQANHLKKLREKENEEFQKEMEKKYLKRNIMRRNELDR